MTSAMTPLFLYGTLRDGEALSHLIPRNVQRADAHVNGHALYYHPRTNGYPVMATNAGAQTHGEVVLVDLDHPAIQYVITMELGAGYDVVWRHIWLDADTSCDGLTFHWTGKLGERIVGDDWLARDIPHVCPECFEEYRSEDDAIDCLLQHEQDDLDAALARSSRKEH